MQERIYLTNAKILYKPDFSIMVLGGSHPEKVFLECKGFETAVWRLKARLWQAYRPDDCLMAYKMVGGSPKLMKVYGKKRACIFGGRLLL